MNSSRSSGHDKSASSPAPSSSGAPPLQPSLGDGLSGTANAARNDVGAAVDSLTADVKHAAATTTRAIKEQASELAADIGHELGKTAEDQKKRGVEAIQGLVRAVNTAASELDQESPRVAGYVRDAARTIEGLSKNIGDRDVSQLVRSASELARSQPLIFFGGAVAAGFVLSRFLKSSVQNERPKSKEWAETGSDTGSAS